MKNKTKGCNKPATIEAVGAHLIAEFWEAKDLNSVAFCEEALRRAVKSCGATLLNVDVHKFSPQGVTGVAVISESHISIHTWPELGYAALDVFVCGGKDPYLAIESLKGSFQPGKVLVTEIKRGILL
jgi:S-adenosylmethionine decarboxylase